MLGFAKTLAGKEIQAQTLKRLLLRLASNSLTFNTFCIPTFMLAAYPGCKRRQQWDVTVQEWPSPPLTAYGHRFLKSGPQPAPLLQPSLAQTDPEHGGKYSCKDIHPLQLPANLISTLTPPSSSKSLPWLQSARTLTAQFFKCFNTAFAFHLIQTK